MGGIEVVHSAELKKGDSTRGILREKAFETEDVLFARSRIAGGVKSDWHHHGERDLYGFLLSGKLRLDFGEGEKDHVDFSTGDFFHIQIGLVHRDVNPDQNQDAVVVNLLLGKGPPVVNVPGP
jgi:uncharacterized RmlC-like cupin family protein